jgi:hypothetical protein
MKVEDGGVHSKRYDGCCTNNELEFQSPHEHHPFWGKGPHVEHPFAMHL